MNMQMPAFTRDVYLYNLSTPKYDHKLLAQISIGKRSGYYLAIVNGINPDWKTGLDDFAVCLCDRVISQCQGQRLIAPSHKDIICELFQLSPANTHFVGDQMGQRTDVIIEQKPVQISVDDWRSTDPYLPDEIDAKDEPGGVTVLRIGKVIGLAKEECFTLSGSGVGLIKQILRGCGFSNSFLIQSTQAQGHFALEIVDLARNRKKFEDGKAVIDRLKHSQHFVKIHSVHELPYSQQGLLVKEVRDARMAEDKSLFQAGVDDHRVRVIGKQLLEIIDDLDRHNIHYRHLQLYDFFYCKNGRKIKIDAFERGRIVNGCHPPNPIRVVSTMLEDLVWDWQQPKEKPDWLSMAMYEFINTTIKSRVSAAEALQSAVFKDLGENPRLILETPEIPHYELCDPGRHLLPGAN